MIQLYHVGLAAISELYWRRAGHRVPEKQIDYRLEAIYGISFSLVLDYGWKVPLAPYGTAVRSLLETIVTPP